MIKYVCKLCGSVCKLTKIDDKNRLKGYCETCKFEVYIKPGKI